MNAQTEIKQPDAITHKTIFEAIAAAVGDVRKVGKGDRNKFDGYDFASIDKFLELVNPICAKHGLFPLAPVREVEFYENTNAKGSRSTWGRFFFDITLNHASGQQLGPINMMVAVPMNGAQASGSAQSYALKQFFRGVFMIPTGDKDDPDLNATEQHVAATITPDQFIKLRDKMESAGADESAFLKAYNAQSLQQFPLNCFADAMVKLQRKIDQKAPPANADLGGDEIPNFEGQTE